jgi:hypothetical protein
VAAKRCGGQGIPTASDLPQSASTTRPVFFTSQPNAVTLLSAGRVVGAYCALPERSGACWPTGVSLIFGRLDAGARSNLVDVHVVAARPWGHLNQIIGLI